MKKLDQLKPDEVIAWIKKRIRELFGDSVENSSLAYAYHGYYYIVLRDFGYKMLAESGPLRRSQIGKWLKEQKV